MVFLGSECLQMCSVCTAVFRRILSLAETVFGFNEVTTAHVNFENLQQNCGLHDTETFAVALFMILITDFK